MLVVLVKVSANPKLTVLHNFGFLYHSIDLRNSFRLKKKHQKMLFVREVMKGKQFCHLNCSNWPPTALVIALSNKERLRDS